MLRDLTQYARQNSIEVLDVRAMLAAATFQEMLDWIYSDFIKDAHLSEEALALEGFQVRSTSRTLSYVSQVCTLEGILRRAYKDMIGKIKLIKPTINVDVVKLDERAREIEDIKTFRNKIAAHTSYSCPKMFKKGVEDDNLSAQFNSLQRLISYSYDTKDGLISFCVGEGTLHVSGEAPNVEIPEMRLKELHPRVVEHLDNWVAMFRDKLSAINL